jgi:hypothetical protein
MQQLNPRAMSCAIYIKPQAINTGLSQKAFVQAKTRSRRPTGKRR